MAKNRREALKQGFALLGAAVGIGAAKKVLSVTPEAPSETNSGKQFVVHARGLRIRSQDIRRGELPPAGIRMLAKADIVSDPSSSQKAGEFFASYFRINAPGKVADHDPGTIEQHTFVLPEGNIFGSGVATSGLESEGQFAITGGTGRYLGVRGSYVARQSYLDFGGNGIATFTVTLI